MNTAPFDLKGELDAGVLCVHGFTSTPFEVRYLAESLQQRGFHTVGIALPGHCTSVEELDGTTWRDWFGAVEAEYAAMSRRFARVALAGQSLGGLLSLYLAAQTPGVAAVATLAAPLWLEGLGKRLAEWTRPGRWLHGRLRKVPKVGGSDLADKAVKATYPGYKSVPMACARRIAERTRAERTRLLDRSFHLISLDLEREIVAEEVGTFLSRHLGGKPGEDS